MPGTAQDAYLFDIDGTLLRSRDRVHFDSFAASVQRVTGFEVTLAGILLHGSTDTAILREACHQAGVPAEVLEARIGRHPGSHAPRVAERRHEMDLVLHAGRGRRFWTTWPGAARCWAWPRGNLEAIGWIKIEQAGLREWFRFGGFSDHFPIRSELIGHAARKARELAGPTDASRSAWSATRRATLRRRAPISSP